MKNLFFIALLVVTYSAMAQSEFSSPTIQIGVVVEDLERSKEFYTNIVGMRQTGGFDVTTEIAKATGLTDGKPLSVAVMKLEDSPSTNEWKLMSFGKKGENADHQFIDSDTGMRYITIFYNTLNDVWKRIKDNDIATLGDTPVLLPDGRHFILVKDPDGTFIELIGGME
ncbi:MAG: VOC family protein [Cyclobacteriaceae bacterium]